ncbi:MAG: tyrosine-protein phosphatase [Eubacteriaceae bacterium]|nr:tyrosine-protein phosphatase [Eubacteriaceae bacterium]
MRNVNANLPLKLEGSKNTRELGGYPTLEGGNTANGQFLRSDSPSNFTNTNKQRLYEYGVRLAIDFRSSSEIDEAPCALKGYKDIEYINPQLIDAIYSTDESGSQNIELPSVLGDMYISFLDDKKAVYLGVFKAILGYEGKCVFFNCSAGKDRAGMLAMMLLKVAGVADQNIVIDYQATGGYIKEDMDRALENFRSQGIDFDEDMLKSRPIHMQRAIEHMNAAYGGIFGWLKAVGLNEGEIAKLKGMALGSYS